MSRTNGKKKEYRVHYYTSPSLETWPMRWAVYEHPVYWKAPIMCRCSTRDLARTICKLLNQRERTK